eukprot:745266-Pyramimonas_sp.AAC.1
MTPKISQHNPRWLKIAPIMHGKGPKTAPRRLELATDPPRTPPRDRTPFKNKLEINVLCVLPRPFASDELLGPQDGPTTAKASPKMGPREAQDWHKSAHERPKRGARWAREATCRAPTGVHQ